jgi:hypothetical protein
MDEDASLAPAMDVANGLPLDVAPSAPRVTLANEKECLYLPPEGTFVCVALREGVLPPELIVFTIDGATRGRTRRVHGCTLAEGRKGQR